MPRRLLLAAEILRDVARTVNAADRPLLEAAADELSDRAADLIAEEEASFEPAREIAAKWPSPLGVTGMLARAKADRGEMLVH